MIGFTEKVTFQLNQQQWVGFSYVETGNVSTLQKGMALGELNKYAALLVFKVYADNG